MFHEDILYISYRRHIKTEFLISNMHCQELHLDNFKGSFLNNSIFLLLSDSRFSNSYISAKSYPNKPYINGKFYSAFGWCINKKVKK